MAFKWGCMADMNQSGLFLRKVYNRVSENPPVAERRRGLRGGKSTKLKRVAYIRNILKFTDAEDTTLVPVIHTGSTSRPLYTSRGWEPTYSSSKAGSGVEVVAVEETPETPSPGAASATSTGPRLHQSSLPHLRFLQGSRESKL